MFRQIMGFLMVLALSTTTAHTATLGIPAPHTTVSGIGVISGWKCHENGELTVRFDGGQPIPLLYGAQRPDVLRAGACAHDRVGFLTVWNWGELSDGPHTAVVYDDGVEFDRSTFNVVTTGEGFLQGVTGSGTATLSNGQKVTLEWSQASQSFVATDFTEPRRTDSRICTTKTVRVRRGSRENETATWTVTNPCDGETLDIDITSTGSEGYWVCSLTIVQNGVQFDGYPSFDWWDRNTFDSVCGDVLPGLTKQTTVEVREGSQLDFLDPFQLYYRDTLLFTFP